MRAFAVRASRRSLDVELIYVPLIVVYFLHPDLFARVMFVFQTMVNFVTTV